MRLDIAGIAGTRSALADIMVLGFALAASMRASSPAELRLYRFGVHLALLAWLWRELSIHPNGAAYVSGAWGAYGVALLVVGVRERYDVLQKTALATLLVLVAKLFMIDLAALEALWRILLFLTIGGVFLLLSYLLQGAWQGTARASGGR